MIVGSIINVLVFILKGWILVFIMMWVRWTLPRLRIDQVMMMCLKYLIPISCLLLAGVSLWQLVLSSVVVIHFHYVLFALSVVLLVLLVKTLFCWVSSSPGTG